MNTRTIYTALAVGATLTAACASFAQSTTTFSRDGRPERIFRPVAGLTQADSNFMMQAAYINMFELQAAKVAEARGTSEFTKEFAKEMIADHTGALDQLKQIAAQKGVTLPSDIPQSMQHTINFISSLNGADFDSTYRRTQIDGHEKVAAMFKHYLANGHDEDVKAYAVITLPEVTLHLHLAMEQKTMMGATKADHGT